MSESPKGNSLSFSLLDISSQKEKALKELELTSKRIAASAQERIIFDVGVSCYLLH